MAGLGRTLSTAPPQAPGWGSMRWHAVAQVHQPVRGSCPGSLRSARTPFDAVTAALPRQDRLDLGLEVT
jgi:hypothetical protein